jgi:hypothetical protein
VWQILYGLGLNNETWLKNAVPCDAERLFRENPWKSGVFDPQDDFPVSFLSAAIHKDLPDKPRSVVSMEPSSKSERQTVTRSPPLPPCLNFDHLVMTATKYHEEATTSLPFKADLRH